MHTTRTMIATFLTQALLWNVMAPAQTQPSPDLTLTVANTPKAISPDLFGIFFEDLNYAADGGLYGELVQNRSFEYQTTEQRAWNNASFWELVTRGGGRGTFDIGASVVVHRNNPHYAVLEVHEVGEGVGLMNGGFDGIAVKAGEMYDFSMFARQLFSNARWGRGSAIDGPMPIVVRLERENGQVLGEAKLDVSGREWKQVTGSIVAKETDAKARLVVLGMARGGVTLDEISLFPKNTFKNRKNGLRTDLAQTVADLKPKFVRFPGGCLVHGNGLNNFYNWKDTIGPIEQRRGQLNIWGYHQSMGLGYYEYFQFCEDIGAKPLPVVPAAVSCQNAGHVSHIGQQCVAMEDMPAYIQDVLDLIEWANGPADSKWGAKRAAAGHPEPFGLKYLGVGNEDRITPGFEERFKMIFDAIKAKHPEIVVIGTVGPSPAGEDFDAGWKVADALKVPMVDEHYYMKPDWFWDNLKRYDGYDRKRSAVYLGEYAAHDDRRRSTLRSALAEAAYMTAMERNGDVVRMASYAPLLAKRGRTQWTPDLIYFDNTTVSPTINYEVQKLFGHHAGDASLPVTVKAAVPAPEKSPETFATSCVRDDKSGDIILKLVSRAEKPVKLDIDLSALPIAPGEAKCVVLSGDAMAENAFGRPAVAPQSRTITAGAKFAYELPPQSFVVIRLPAQAAKR